MASMAGVSKREWSKVSNIQIIQSLKNHFLIAMPILSDKYFARSVTFIVEHSSEGAMGIVINQPSNISFKQLMEMADSTVEVGRLLQDKIVVCGGPVHGDRGFIVHSPQGGYSSSIDVSSQIMLTTSKDILSKLGKQDGPEKSLVALGYAGWQAGQLEQEIQDNAWLTVEADYEILFETPIHKKWQAAVNKLGIDIWQLTQQAGQA
jgi:putative transcriptional regulator